MPFAPPTYEQQLILSQPNGGASGWTNQQFWDYQDMLAGAPVGTSYPWNQQPLTPQLTAPSYMPPATPPTTTTPAGPPAAPALPSAPTTPTAPQAPQSIEDLFAGSTNTLARDQFEELIRQFNLQMANTQAMTQAQIENLVRTGNLNEQALQEVIRSAQSREALARDQFTTSVQQFQQAFSEGQRQFDVGATGYVNGQPTLQREGQEFNQNLALAALQANPRTLAQALLALGASPEQASATLNALPKVQALYAKIGYNPTLQSASPPAPTGAGAANGGVSIPSGEAASAVPLTGATSAGTASPLTGPGGIASPTPPAAIQFNAQGRNAAFPFVSGRQLDFRDTLQAMRTGNTPWLDTLSSLASFSGQDPNAFFADFQQAAPQGQLASLSTFR